VRDDDSLFFVSSLDYCAVLVVVGGTGTTVEKHDVVCNDVSISG
jgi:hypothetical protein